MTNTPESRRRIIRRPEVHAAVISSLQAEADRDKSWLPGQRRIARSPEIQRLTGRSRTTLWRLERAGKFPRRVQLGENSVGYFLDEVILWLEALPRVGPGEGADE